MYGKFLLTVPCLLFVALGTESALAAASTSDLPTPLVNADKAYKQNGAEAYLAALLENAIPDDVTSKASLLKQARIVSELLRQVESLYGTYEGVELIESIQIAKSTRVVYYLLNFETGPVYGVLSVYKTTQGEIVTGFAVNTELHKVVPPTLIINRAKTRIR